MNLRPKKNDDIRQFPTFSDFQRNRREYLKKILKYASVVLTASIFGCSGKDKTEMETKPLQSLPGEPPLVSPSVQDETIPDAFPKKTGILMAVKPDTSGTQDSTGENPACNTSVKKDSCLKKTDDIPRKKGVMPKPGKIRSISDPTK